MKKVFAAGAVIAIIVVVWFLASSVSNKNTVHTQTQVVPYETSVSSVRYPAGTQVEQHKEQDEDVVSYDYDGLIPKRSSVAIVSYSDSAKPPQEEVATAMSKSPPAAFKPGYWSSPITDTTVGELPGKEQTLRGETSDSAGDVTVRWRMANSPDGLRVWTLMTSSRGNNGLSEEDSEKFFDSLKIK